ncbi:MAG TPA: hypothetical protein VGD05_03415 [Pyrinomonadaceae bacterium]|jgi:hypothetical protein
MYCIALSECGDGFEACPQCRPGAEVETTEADDGDGDEDLIDSLIAEAESIVTNEDGGAVTDWNYYDPELYPLVAEWRKAEKELAAVFAIRHQQFIKSHYEKK